MQPQDFWAIEFLDPAIGWVLWDRMQDAEVARLRFERDKREMERPVRLVRYAGTVVESTEPATIANVKMAGAKMVENPFYRKG